MDSLELGVGTRKRRSGLPGDAGPLVDGGEGKSGATEIAGVVVRRSVKVPKGEWGRATPILPAAECSGNMSTGAILGDSRGSLIVARAVDVAPDGEAGVELQDQNEEGDEGTSSEAFNSKSGSGLNTCTTSEGTAG